MNGANRMLMSAFHDYCNAMWARTDIDDTTRWEQMVKFGYGIQWLTTGTFCSSNPGWSQQTLRGWGFSEVKMPSSGAGYIHMTTEDYIPQPLEEYASISAYDAGKDIWDMVDFEKDTK